MTVEKLLPTPDFSSGEAGTDRANAVAVMAAAVRQAWEIARVDGDVEAVLLAPAAASLDMFDSYAARGDAFTAAAAVVAGDPR